VAALPADWPVTAPLVVVALTVDVVVALDFGLVVEVVDVCCFSKILDRARDRRDHRPEAELGRVAHQLQGALLVLDAGSWTMTEPP